MVLVKNPRPFRAGEFQETTATALAWAFYWIHSLPRVRQKLLQELDSLGENPDPMELSRLPYLSAVLELRVFGNEGYRQAVLVARLDNLGKGASGAAVQNLKLMLGI